MKLVFALTGMVVCGAAAATLLQGEHAGQDEHTEEAAHDGSICPSARQAEVSAELKGIYEADQNERTSATSENMAKRAFQIYQNDKIRRRDVAILFAEGCINSARDYYYASVIFQHGEHADHTYQAYLWANKALELGEKAATGMIPVTIDRYLVEIGHKQLFGTQSLVTGLHTSKREMCVQPVEDSFTDEERVRITGRTRADFVAQVTAYKAMVGYEGEVPFCDTGATTPPKGLFPGVW